MITRLSLAALVLAAATATARAQPSPPAPDPTPPEAAAPAPDAATAKTPPVSGADRAPTATERTAYDAAFDALVAGDFARAVETFDRLGTTSTGAFAAGARALARLARRLQAGQIRFVSPGSPAGPNAMPAIQREVPEDDQPGSGRIGMVVSTTLSGFYGGIALLDILDVGDFRAGVALVTAATGGAFAISLVGTRGRDIRAGVADAYGTGLLLGLTNGLLLASPLGLDDDSEQVLGLGLGGLVLGGTTALLVADRTKPTVGQSSLVLTTSLLGIATTGLGMVLVADEDTIDADAVLLLLAGGLDVGAAVGMTLAPRVSWSKGRARLSSLGMFLGGLTGFGVGAIIVGEPDDDTEAKALAAATLAGLYAGFGLTVRLTRDMSPDPRFATDSTALAITPTVVRGGGGLAVGGRF